MRTHRIILALFVLSLVASACQSAPALSSTPSSGPSSTPAQSAAPSSTPAQSSAQTAPRPSATLPLAPTRTPVSIGGPTPPRTGGPDLKGTFLFAPGDGSIWLQDANGANPRVIVKSTAETFAESPAFSPDGKLVAFAMNTLNKDGLVVKDIRLVNADGSNMRTVAAPPSPKTAYSAPSFSPDGKQVYFAQSYPVPPSGEYSEIDRVAVTGGALAKVIETGRSPNVSPDGKKIVFQRFDFKTFAASLWVANSDGSAAKQILDQDAFLAILGARFSPDSASIVFSASGPPNKKLPGLSYRSAPAASDCWMGLGPLCVVARAYADGLPWDLWLVAADGSKFEQLTKIGSDSPYPAWSPDGKYVAFFDISGFYVVNRETKALNQVIQGGGHGALDWR